VTGSRDDPAVRNLLSSLRALLALTTLMIEHDDEDEVVSLATAAVSSLGQCRAEGVYLDGRWRDAGSEDRADDKEKLEAQLHLIGGAGGPLDIPGRTWGWAYALTTPGGASAYLVVGAADEPSEDLQFLLRTLAQQMGLALANARLHARERLTAEELRVANLALQRRVDIHERLTQVVTAGEGQVGIARAVHELTGYQVAIEDRWGTLRAWAGPGPPKAYPRQEATRREALLRRMQPAGQPIREQDRLLVMASPREDVVGVLALVDPDRTAGEREQVTLEHAATVLAMELARLSSLTETERRQRRDLIEELLAGHDDEAAAFNRAQAIGYDLGRPHRVVVATIGTDKDDGERLFHAVRRAARDLEAGSLLVARAGEVVLFSDNDTPWEQFQAAVDAQLRKDHCRLGVGTVCERPREFVRSHHEAQLALKMQKALGGGQAVTRFEDLGVYQVLSELADVGSVDRFVRRWLGSLMDHDAQRGSDLVATLSGYLERGGHYDAAAKLLMVHRSTLKYRLQQIRAITGYDLGDPDISFNLHLATRAWRTLEALRQA